MTRILAMKHAPIGAVVLVGAFVCVAAPAAAQTPDQDPELFCLKHPDELDPVTREPCEGNGVSAPGQDPGFEGPGNNNPQPGYHDNGRGGNTFVNDPCLDPPPPTRQRTVQSETEIAVFGKYMVAGYNDSFGFYNSNQGLTGI